MRTSSSALRLHLAGGLAAILIGTMGDSAAAGRFEELHRQAVVNYYDLDLGKPENVAELYMRIRRAARTVCTEPGLRSVGQAAQRRSCIATAVDDAVESIGAASLTSHHVAHTRGAPAALRTAGRQ